MTTDQQTRKATITTPADREIHVERTFDAPRDEVFAAMTNPDLIPDWWGPHGTTTVVDKMDARSGGDWRYVVKNSDGTETGFRGAYREVTAPERIVQTFEWEGMPGHVSVDTATSVFHTAEERDGMLGSGMEGGMNETYERFDAVLACA